MMKVTIVGAAGRMGKTLIQCLQDESVPGLALHAAVDLWDAPGLNQEANCGAGVLLTSDLGAAVEGTDVFVDFSTHMSTAGNAERIAGWGKPWVIGTTGLSDEEKGLIADTAKRVPVVMAPNMSLGVNLLFCLVEQAATALRDKGFDIEVIERHHRRKKDAPSGTALGLGEAAAKGYQWNLSDVAVDGRTGMAKDERPAKEIGFHAVRAGDIVGDHTVLFATDGESIELSHRATSRSAFAIGLSAYSTVDLYCRGATASMSAPLRTSWPVCAR